MLKDPSTGKMVTAPEYGGTIVFPPTGNGPEQPHEALELYPPPPDEDAPNRAKPKIVIKGNYIISEAIAPVLEKMGMTDWSTPRDKECFCAWSAKRLRSLSPLLETSKPHLHFFLIWGLTLCK